MVLLLRDVVLLLSFQRRVFFILVLMGHHTVVGVVGPAYGIIDAHAHAPQPLALPMATRLYSTGPSEAQYSSRYPTCRHAWGCRIDYDGELENRAGYRFRRRLPLDSGRFLTFESRCLDLVALRYSFVVLADMFITSLAIILFSIMLGLLGELLNFVNRWYRQRSTLWTIHELTSHQSISTYFGGKVATRVWHTRLQKNRGKFLRVLESVG